MVSKGFHLIVNIFLALSLISCEDTPDISIEGRPVPIIYGVFDKLDYVHYIKIGKTFQANENPMSSAVVCDSLYFDDPEVRVILTDYYERATVIEPYLVKEIPKDEGMFNFPGQVIYRFNTRLGGIRTLGVRVKAAGLEESYGEVLLLDSASINTPKKGQQTLYLVPDTPIRIQWVIPDSSGSPFHWYEIDVAFEFLETTSDSTRSAKVVIQNTNWYETATPKYYELNITYEEFIREVLAQLKDDPDVKWRRFGYHSIEINCADKNITDYINKLNGINDFNYLPFSNITNGIGLIASRSSGLKDSLRFDYKTRLQLSGENRLKKYKLLSD